MLEVVERFDAPSTVSDWKTVDDVVMGGRSSSQIDWVETGEGEGPPGWLRFEGHVSLENNGGFCSTRQREADRGRPGLAAVRLLVRGTDRRYKWTIRTEATPESSSWRHPFEIDGQGEHLIECRFEDFELWRRGTRLSTDAPLDPAGITSFGILISDKQAGDFRLDLARYETGGE